MGKVVGVAFVVVVAAACVARGPEPLPLEAYRDAVVDAATLHREQVDAFQRRYERELPLLVKRLERDLQAGDARSEAAFVQAAVAETRRATAELLADVAGADARYRDVLTSLTPPQAVAEEHDALVDAIGIAVAGVPGTLDALDAAESFDAIDAALGGSVYTDAQPRIVAACDALQRRLRDLGFGGDLGCG